MKKLIGTTFLVSAVAFASNAIAEVREITVTETETITTQPATLNETVSSFQSQEIISVNGEVVEEKEIYFESATEPLEKDIMAVSPEEAQKTLRLIETRKEIKTLTPEEKAEKVFEIMDMDNDGVISKEEFMNFHHKISEKRKERMVSQTLPAPID